MARAIKLIDSPIGLFEVDGVLVLKTEYSTRHEDGTITPDCYIIESGEYFWGGGDSVLERNNLEVAPVDIPTITPPNEWVSVEERLPENDGWYLVYAPEYWGHSKIYGLDGLAYSNFKHNYKVHWGIERGTGRGYPGIVTHWMPLPAPPTKEE